MAQKGSIYDRTRSRCYCADGFTHGDSGGSSVVDWNTWTETAAFRVHSNNSSTAMQGNGAARIAAEVMRRTRRISGGAAVRCIRWFAGVSYEKDDAKRRISNMSGEWIPVTERLPDKSEPVLLFCPPEDDEDTWLTYCDIGRYSHTVKGNHWFDTDDGGAVPTHWMPLPAPPTDAK